AHPRQAGVQAQGVGDVEGGVAAQRPGVDVDVVGGGVGQDAGQGGAGQVFLDLDTGAERGFIAQVGGADEAAEAHVRADQGGQVGGAVEGGVVVAGEIGLAGGAGQGHGPFAEGGHGHDAID